MPSPPEVFGVAELATPTGAMRAVFDDEERLRALDWVDYASRLERLLGQHYGAPDRGYRLRAAALPARIGSPLSAYFAGELAALERISTETAGTAFQRAVWAALRGIEAGQTASYGALAAHIGRPRAVRAVGAANGANPIAVVVPCHRVIGSDRGLTGYGGGLERKRWLLAHEGALLV